MGRQTSSVLRGRRRSRSQPVWPAPRWVTGTDGLPPAITPGVVGTIPVGTANKVRSGTLAARGDRNRLQWNGFRTRGGRAGDRGELGPARGYQRCRRGQRVRGADHLVPADVAAVTSGTLPRGATGRSAAGCRVSRKLAIRADRPARPVRPR